MTLEERMHAVDDEFGKFDRVTNKLSNRSDLHAFILLDKLMPGGDWPFPDLIAAAEHDQIYLSIDCDKLNDVITDEQVLELVRCGVMYSEDSLSLFV